MKTIMKKLKMFEEQPKNALQLSKTFDTLKEAKEFVGFELLSKPEKMAEYGFNMPASRCKAGSKMAKVKGTVCYDCYALKGRYKFANTQNALEKRYQFAINSPYFVDIMSYIVGKRSKKVFRWFDSGDLQSTTMLEHICQVARNTPQLSHWLPTKEWKIVARFVEDGGVFPENLCVRVSGLYKDGGPPKDFAEKYGVTTSDVMNGKDFDNLKQVRPVFKCPSSKQKNSCEDCIACYKNSVKNVTYRFH